MLAVLPDRCASRVCVLSGSLCVQHLIKQASLSRHRTLDTMPGTRAQALAPRHHPDEAEPDPDIPMVATEAAHDPQDQPADEPQPAQDQGAGVLGQATRTLSGFLAGRNGTPGTRTPRARLMLSEPGFV